jgi:hypothetical protein
MRCSWAATAEGTPLAVTGNWDPNNPTAVTTANTVDPNLKNDRTDEFIAGFDHEIAPGFAAGVNYIWRRYGGIQFFDVLGLQSSDYAAVQYTPAASTCPASQAARCPTVTYYQPLFQLPTITNLTNFATDSIQQDVQRPGTDRTKADVASLADEYELLVQQHDREQRVHGRGDQHRQ